MNEFIKELENKMVISTNFIWKFHMDLNAMLKDYDNNINEILQKIYTHLAETINAYAKTKDKESKESFIIWQERTKYLAGERKLIDSLRFTISTNTKINTEKSVLVDFIDDSFNCSELNKYLLDSTRAAFSILSGALPVYWYNNKQLLKIEGELSLKAIHILNDAFARDSYLVSRGFKNKYEQLLRKIEKLSQEMELSEIINSTIYSRQTKEEEKKERLDLLFQYVREDYYEGAGALLGGDIDANSQDEDGMTGLMLACSKSEFISYNMIMTFLEKGVDNNIQNSEGNSALMLLSNSVCHESEVNYYVDIMLDHEINCNLQNNHGDTALMIAMRKDYFYVANTLIEKGKANVNILNHKGENALSIASNYDYRLFKGSEITQNDEDELKNSPDYDLIDDFDIIRKGKNELNYLSLWHNVVFTIVEDMLKNEVSSTIIDKYSEIFFMYYVVKNDLENLKKIWEKGKSRILLKEALMNAQSIEVIEFILNEGVDINTQNKHGQTVLHIISKRGSYELINELLKLNADINLKDIKGKDPLHIACINGNTPAAKALIGFGANVNSIDNIGRLPIHNAATHNDLELIKILIDNGAKINEKDYAGYTAIHIACIFGNPDVLQELILQGANPYYENNKKKDAYMLCRDPKCRKVLKDNCDIGMLDLNLDLNLDLLEINPPILTVRAYHTLKKNSLNKLSDLLKISILELKELKNLGNKAFLEIIEVMNDCGFDMVNIKTKEKCDHIDDNEESNLKDIFFKKR